MAITAKFAADFTDFVTSTKSAEAAVHRLEGGGAALGNTFSSTLSSTDRLRNSLGQFDGVLATLGVNIGTPIRGLSELGAASGKTVAEIGLLGTAGLAVGAGMAGWGIGRAVADFFDLDTSIAQATAKLLGWGDAAAEVKGANQDLHDRIMATGAAFGTWKSQAQISADITKAWGAEIAKVADSGDLDQLTKDLASQNFTVKELAARYHVSVEALQFFTREQTKAADADKAAGDKIHANNERLLKDAQDQIDLTKDWRAAMVELNAAGQGWQGTLDTIDGTVVEGIKYYLQAGVSQQALAEAYGLTAAQVKAVSSALRADADATQDAAAEHQRLADAATAAADALEQERAAADKLKREAAAATAAIEALKKANRDMGNSTEFDVGTEAGRLAIPEGIRTWLHDGYSLAQAVQIDFLLRWGLPINANDPLFAHKGPRVPGFASGVENFAGRLALVGERGPELVNLPSGSDVIPMGHGGGIVNNFYLIDNSENLARKTAQMILASMKRGKQLGLA